MALTVNSNIQALNAYRNLSKTQTSLSSSLEKLSSGLRINRAADDAAGLSISETLKSQVNGLKQASRNAQDAISVVQTADGALAQTQSILQRMRVLAVQASNGSLDDKALTNINAEAKELSSEITRIATNTKFNGLDLLGGTSGTTGFAGAGKNFQIGADTGQTITVKIELSAGSAAFTAANLSVDAGTGGTLSLGTAASASAAITAINTAIENVSTARASLGAVQNRFQYTIDNLDTTVENLSAASSRVLDTDMASEMVNFTRAQILSQAGTSMLAQAKNLPTSILTLLQS